MNGIDRCLFTHFLFVCFDLVSAQKESGPVKTSLESDVH